MFISRDEFRKVMTKLGDEPLSEQDADKLLDNLDVDEKDGKLSVTGKDGGLVVDGDHSERVGDVSDLLYEFKTTTTAVIMVTMTTLVEKTFTLHVTFVHQLCTRPLE